VSDRAKIVLAFATMYLVWGSTYLAIKIGLETLPPFLMAGCRFVIASAIMWTWSGLRRDARPTRRQWRDTAIIGALLLLGGNGLVTWAEQKLPSGVAALLVTVTPAWLVLLHWAFGEHKRPTVLKVAGLVLGSIGVGILVAGRTGSGGFPIVSAVVVLLASLAWAIGSMYARTADLPKSPVQTNAMEMLVGGAAMAVVGLALGETGRVNLAHVSLGSWLAFGYLIVFGSIAAFSAYNYVLQNVPPALAGTYAYVNPAVAVLLGRLVGEPLGWRELAAMVVILAGVLVIRRSEASG
jgi:drug/metabolite transporter (DMT)-like permease